MEPRPDHPRLTFADLPSLARIGIAFALFDTWVIFEEGILDRFGLWRYLPLYVRAQFCPWDLAMAGLIFVPVLLLSRRRATGAQAHG